LRGTGRTINVGAGFKPALPRPIPLLGGVPRSGGVVPRAVRGRVPRPPSRRNAPGQGRATPCPGCAVPAHRLCEAPVSPRYVRCYRCEAIQCRECNIRSTYRRILRQPWIASPHIIDYVSQVRRRLRNDGAPRAHPGQGFALPCPGALRRDGGRELRRARRGEPPRRYAPPLPGGEFTGEGGFETRPYVYVVRSPATHVQTLVSDI
jgi:hypothetical protein